MNFFIRILTLCGLFIIIPGAWGYEQNHFDPTKHLVIDTRAIAKVDGLRLTLGEIKKFPGNPLLQANEPWENALNNLYPNIAYDPGTKQLKLWYKCVLSDRDVIAKMDRPSTIHDVGWYQLYATAKDAQTWEKPKLGLHQFNGNANNNAVTRDTPNVGVFRDTNPDCPKDRLYKMIYDVGPGKMRVRFSADGIKWGEPIEPKGFGSRTGDTHNNAFWDARLKKYVCFTRIYLGERLVARAESTDFITWENEKIVLRSTIDEGKEHQCYCMTVFPYGNCYLGLLMMYHVGKDRTVDCELAWSPDSIEWYRVLPGQALIPRGEGKAFDAKCIYAQANPPLLDNNQLTLFYGGSEVAHIGWKRSCLLAGATFNLDGFVGYSAEKKDTPGTLTTTELELKDSNLYCQAAFAAGGRVGVALVDSQGRTIGQGQVNSQSANGTVAWEAKPAINTNERYRLVFTVLQATLYSFRGPKVIPAKKIAAKAPDRLPWDKRFPGVEKKVVTVKSTFDLGSEGWTAIDKISAQDGYVRVTRDGLQPYALATTKAANGAFSGDWEKKYGGTGVKISFKARANQPANATRVEIFAKDIAQWSNEKLPKPTTEWQQYSITLRYDWTDAEAEAAGWRRAVHGFSWRETITHVGQLVIAPMIQVKGLGAFDLDEVQIETIFE